MAEIAEYMGELLKSTPPTRAGPEMFCSESRYHELKSTPPTRAGTLRLRQHLRRMSA